MLKGLAYLTDNSLMKKAARLAEGDRRHGQLKEQQSAIERQLTRGNILADWRFLFDAAAVEKQRRLMRSRPRQQSEGGDMKREFLENLGLDKEAIDKVLDENSGDIGEQVKKQDALKRKVQTLEDQQSDYDALKGEVEALRSDKLSADQKAEKSIKAAEDMKKSYAKKLNRLDAEKKLVAAGLEESDYADLIEGIVSDDPEVTAKLAENLVKMVTAQREKAVTKAKEDGLRGTPKPGAGGAPANPAEMTAEAFGKLTWTDKAKFKLDNPEQYQILVGGN